MPKDRAPDGTPAQHTGRFGEWDDSDYDPHNLPDWSIDAEAEAPPATPTKQDPQFAAFVDELEERLSDDIGWASERRHIDLLARMYIGDKSEYARAEQVLRRHRVLSLVRTAVKTRARELNNLQAVPGGGEALDLVRIREQLPDAPVDADAVVPASWRVDGDPKGPQRYRLIKKVVRRREGEFQTDLVGVAYNPIVISATMIDVADASANLRISWRARGRWRHRVVPREKLCQTRDLITALSGTHGFPANVNNAKDLIAYLADYEAFNEDVIPTRPMTTQMGWQGKAGELGFVAGRTHLAADDDTPAVHFVGADDGEEQLARCVRSSGSLEDWCNAAKIASHFPAVEAGIYAALAPPLLDVLRAPNFTIDWSHKTSAGKTTTLSLAASCWGNPDPNASDTLIGSWDMTSVGFERRAAALSCLPMIVDDTKRARSYRGESDVPRVVYAVTNGQGRVRGSATGTQATSYWRTVMLSTGEQRLIDFDKSGGTPARVVTLWGNPFGANSAVVAEAIRRMREGIMRNYGHAGPAVVQWLLENQDRWDDLREVHGQRWTSIRDRMIAFAGERTMDMSVMDRVAGNLAVLEVTAAVTHSALDLPWEPEDFIDALLPSIVPAAGAVDRELEALRAAVSWAAANRGKFCVGEKHRSDYEPPGGWLGYWEAATYDNWKVLAFFPVPLRKFLAEQGFEPQGIIRQWAEAGWLTLTEAQRMTSRVADLRGRPRMVVVPREVVEGAGDLGAEPEQLEDGKPELDLPF
jgi:hypothetical protein